MQKSFLVNFFIIFLIGCSKNNSGNNSQNNIIDVRTNNLTAIRSYTAKASIVVSYSNGIVSYYGICWNISHLPDTSKNKIILFGTTNYNLTDLQPSTTYYARSFAVSNAKITYGNEVTFTTKATKLALHEDYAGGTIFYIDGTGLHGLTVAPLDLSGTPWDNGVYVVSGFTTNTNVNSGKQNTATILNVLGSTGNYAALKCKNLVANGFNDWFLPSKDELNLMRINLFQIGIGGFDGGDFYWSSSTDNVESYFAWNQNFNSGTARLDIMSNPWLIRPCRAF